VIDSRFSTVICAPLYSVHDDLSTQVRVGQDEGLKHDSSIHCDELVSLPNRRSRTSWARCRGKRWSSSAMHCGLRWTLI